VPKRPKHIRILQRLKLLHMNITMLTWFWSQRSLNMTGSPAAVKMLTSPRFSATVGLYWELEALEEKPRLFRVTRNESLKVIDLGEQWRVVEGKEWEFGGLIDGWKGNRRDCRVVAIGLLELEMKMNPRIDELVMMWL
jgi:hypothetical protein